MLPISAVAHDAVVALDAPMNLVILGATGLVTIAFAALVGTFLLAAVGRGADSRQPLERAGR